MVCSAGSGTGSSSPVFAYRPSRVGTLGGGPPYLDADAARGAFQRHPRLWGVQVSVNEVARAACSEIQVVGHDDPSPLKPTPCRRPGVTVLRAQGTRNPAPPEGDTGRLTKRRGEQARISKPSSVFAIEDSVSKAVVGRPSSAMPPQRKPQAAHVGYGTDNCRSGYRLRMREELITLEHTRLRS